MARCRRVFPLTPNLFVYGSGGGFAKRMWGTAGLSRGWGQPIPSTGENHQFPHSDCKALVGWGNPLFSGTILGCGYCSWMRYLEVFGTLLSSLNKPLQIKQTPLLSVPQRCRRWRGRLEPGEQRPQHSYRLILRDLFIHVHTLLICIHNVKLYLYMCLHKLAHRCLHTNVTCHIL